MPGKSRLIGPRDRAFLRALAARPIRIVLADDHAVVRRGFRMILAGPPDMEVVGEASDGPDAGPQFVVEVSGVEAHDAPKWTAP